MKQFDLLGVLNFIDPTSCSYQEWLQVGMALQKEGYPLSAWDNWSALDSVRYHSGECSKKWEGFRGSPNPVTGATITMMAKERGWKPKEREAGQAAVRQGHHRHHLSGWICHRYHWRPKPKPAVAWHNLETHVAGPCAYRGRRILGEREEIHVRSRGHGRRSGTPTH